MEAFQRISSATDKKTEEGKVGKVVKRQYYGTREEWVTDKRNQEQEAVDFEIKYDTWHNSQQKQGASNPIRGWVIIIKSRQNKENNWIRRRHASYNKANYNRTSKTRC